MDQEFFREYAEIEDTHWWFRGRRAIFGRLLERFERAPGLRILDIGFGTGAMLAFLARYGEVIGMDMSAEAIRFARTRCNHPMLRGDISHIPLRTGSVGLVTAFDILEHVDSDREALAELARVCSSGGFVLLTVPAFRFLWGNQDVISHHRRRYTRSELRQMVEGVGFRVVTLSYFNALLFPVVAAVRMGRRLRGAQRGVIKSDFTMTKPGVLNNVLTRIFAAEGALLSSWRLPVGVSVVCLAQRVARSAG